MDKIKKRIEKEALIQYLRYNLQKRGKSPSVNHKKNYYLINNQRVKLYIETSKNKEILIPEKFLKDCLKHKCNLIIINGFMTGKSTIRKFLLEELNYIFNLKQIERKEDKIYYCIRTKKYKHWDKFL